MLTIMTAMALAAAAQPAVTAPAANQHAQHTQAGQMDHSKMDHSKMGQHGDGCCKKGADGKMECTMSKKTGASSDHKGHSGH
jgi:hypothetical protein